jgi:hypothetical protein
MATLTVTPKSRRDDMANEAKLAKLPKWAQDHISQLERKNDDLTETVKAIGGCSLEEARELKVCARKRTYDDVECIPLDEHSPVQFRVGAVKHDRNVIRVLIVERNGREVLEINADVYLRVVAVGSNGIRVYPSDKL